MASIRSGIGENMEDRYLFKAKCFEKWHIGNIVKEPDGLYIRDIKENVMAYIDDESTICQCTGMPDKNSKVAYEHDIIETPVGNAKIIWNCSLSPTDKHINVGFEVVFLDATANDSYRHDLGYWIGKSNIIGNIFDNPELLESEG